MTYKAAMAGLQLGGGKAVIIGDSAHARPPALFEAFGRFVETLGGRYITAEDIGTTTARHGDVAQQTALRRPASSPRRRLRRSRRR